MPQFVVLLRGVNVGKAQRVPMAEFKALLEAQGFTGVRTLLNSGNAVASHNSRSADALAAKVHAALQDQLGLNVPVLVKTAAGFSAAVAAHPGPVPAVEEHPRLLVAFAQQAADLQSLAALQPLLQGDESLHIGSHAAYLHCAGGILQSKAAAAMLGKAGRSLTSRNWATVLKIQALLRPTDQSQAASE